MRRKQIAIPDPDGFSAMVNDASIVIPIQMKPNILTKNFSTTSSL